MRSLIGIKYNVYACAYRWPSDETVGQEILTLWNPVINTKNLYVLSANFGVYGASSTIGVNTGVGRCILTTNGVDRTDIQKYNQDQPASIAKLYSGINSGFFSPFEVRSLVLSSGMPSYGIDFKQEYVIKPGEGLYVQHLAETAAITSYFPWASFTWWE